MDNSKCDKAYFYNLDYENKLCVDCRNAMPNCVSINHGIIICHSCAEIHLKLGYNISYVRKIDDKWDQYLLSFIQRGGNNRFLRFIRQYMIDSLSIEEKYTTRILEYYRLLIKSEVNSDEPPPEIPFDNIRDPCYFDIEYFPEFNNYSIYKGENRPISFKDKIYNKSSGLFGFLKLKGNILFKPVSFIGKAAGNLMQNCFNEGYGNKRNKYTYLENNNIETNVNIAYIDNNNNVKRGSNEQFEIIRNNNYPLLEEIKAYNQNFIEVFGFIDESLIHPNLEFNKTEQLFEEAIIEFPEIGKYENSYKARAREEANKFLLLN